MDGGPFLIAEGLFSGALWEQMKKKRSYLWDFVEKSQIGHYAI